MADPLPKDPKELYELDSEHHTKAGKYRLGHSTILRFLDKAAVKTESRSSWALYPVPQVEETKQMVKMLPVLFVTLIPRVVNTQSYTLFVKQATTLDRSIGPHFKVPPASLSAFITIFMLVGIIVYDRWFVLMMRKRTKNPRGITLLQRLGIGLVLHLVLLITASLTEMKRLRVAPEGMKSLGTSFYTTGIGVGSFLIRFILSTISNVSKKGGDYYYG